MLSIQKTGIPISKFQLKGGATVLSHAFHEDPIITFMFPDVQMREQILPWLFEKIIHYGHLYGKVFTTSEVEGIAVWLGPRNPDLNWWGIFRTGLAWLPFKLKWSVMNRILSLSYYADQMHKKTIGGHHWYLFILGVDPSIQGQGVGRSLVKPILNQADSEGVSCYLETANVRNFSFYERLGFVTAHHGRKKRNWPYINAMVRKPVEKC